jgi:hypothetical protein
MLWLVPLTLPWALLALRPGVSSSRRLLAAVLALMVPVAGPLLALLVRRAKGGKIALEPTEARKRSRPSALDVNRLGDMPSAVERLLSRDPAERLEALVHLSSVADDHAVATLRWTIEHGPTEVVLEAALTLEEIEIRRAARMVALPSVATPAPTVAPTPATISKALGGLVPQWMKTETEAARAATTTAA